jgi:type II secretory pathway pseudopilin PulG
MFKLFIFSKGKKTKGFSIVEIMAVIFIVTVGMVGMLTLIYQSIKVQRLNKHTLIAYQLAQEGVELLRVIRDDNWFSGLNDPFDAILPTGSYCLAYDDINLSISAEACPLYIDNLGFYNHNPSGAPTPYSRLITLSPIADYEEVGVLVEIDIFWSEVGGSLFNYKVETNLYNWY